METKNQILTDRSRSIEFQRCPRARFLGYHWGGHGLALAGLSVPLTTGTYVHVGVGAVLAGKSVEEGVERAVAAYDAEVGRRGFADPHTDAAETVAEQRALTEALVRVFAVRRWPELTREFEVLETEREDEFELTRLQPRYISIQTPTGGGPNQSAEYECVDGEPVVWMSRADALLRQRETDDLYVYSLKTASQWSQTRDEEARHDMQGLSEIAGIEERLTREDRPAQLMGVQMDYLVKGDRNARSGWRQDSPLVRPWRKVSQFGPAEWVWTTKVPCVEPQTCKYHRSRPSANPYHNLGDEWERVNVWEHTSVREWVEMLASGAVQPEAGDPLAHAVITPVPYFRQRDEMEAWRRQMAGQEGRVARLLTEDADQVREPTLPWLDEFWPQHRRSCDWPSKCVFQRICFEGALDDPLGNGYVWRVPHHAPELVQK